MFYITGHYRAPGKSLPLDQPFVKFFSESNVSVRRPRNVGKYWAARTFRASESSDKWVSYCPFHVSLKDGTEVAITPVWRNVGSEDSPQFVLHSIHKGFSGTQTDDRDDVFKWQFPITAFDVDEVDHSMLRLIVPGNGGEGSSEELEPR